MEEPSGAEEPLLPQPKSSTEEFLDLDPEDPQRHLYPAPFYCPLTRKVMEDPVVGPDGDSFERSAALERDAADGVGAPPRHAPRTYYPNRALRRAIQGEIDRAMERGAPREAGEGSRAGLGAALGTEDDGDGRPLPDVYYCPITLDLMVRPAVDPDGNTFERRAIRSWIRRNRSSPLTRKEMSVRQLRDNRALEDMLFVEVERVADRNDPSVLRWIEARKLIEDEEHRLSALLEEEEEVGDSEDHGYGSVPASPEEDHGDGMSRGRYVFGFAVSFLMLSWSIFALVPLDILPLNILIYVVMGLLIAFLNMVLVDQIARPRN